MVYLYTEFGMSFCNVIRETQKSKLHFDSPGLNPSKPNLLVHGKPQYKACFRGFKLGDEILWNPFVSKTPNFEAINMSLVEARRALRVVFFWGVWKSKKKCLGKCRNSLVPKPGTLGFNAWKFEKVHS